MIRNNEQMKISTLGFTSFHPLVSILYYFIFIVFATICIHPISLSILLSGAMTYNYMITSAKQVNKSLKYTLPIGLMIMIINPLFNHRGEHVLFVAFNRNYTLEALIYGFLMSLSIISIILVFYSYQRIVDHHKFIYSLGKILPKTALMITMTLRYIPLLLKRRKEIDEIHSKNEEHMSFVGRIKNSMKTLGILITWSLENALTTVDSMKSRAYGIGKRTSYKGYKFQIKDGMLMGIQVIFLLVIIFLRNSNYLNLQVYPYLVFKLDTYELIGNIALGFFVYIPVIIDVKEKILWRYII